MTDTLTSNNPGNVFFQGAGSTTTSASGPVITNTYGSGTGPIVINLGTVEVTSTGDHSAGILLMPSPERLGTFGAIVSNGQASGSSALIAGAPIGVDFEPGSTLATNGTVNGYVSNFGSIIISANNTPFTAGVLFGNGVGGTVVNSGLILNSAGAGADVYFNGGTNNSAGQIDSVTNSGTMLSSAGHPSIEILNALGSSSVFNTGSIDQGIELGGASGKGTVENLGFIGPTGVPVGGLNEAILGGYNDLLIVGAGSSLGGAAIFGGSSTLDLVAGTGIGTLNAANYPTTRYGGFTALTIKSGADWQIGTATSATSVSSVTTITDLGTLNVAGSITGTSINLGGNSAASVLNATFGTDFPPDSAFFNEPIFGQSITNFGTTDKISVTGLSVATGAIIQTFYANGVLTLVESGPNGSQTGGHTELFNITGPAGSTLTASQFQITSGPNGIVITDTPCFAAGTRILTGRGQVTVESLQPGDTVLTARDGSEQAVVWVGQRTVDLLRHADPEKVLPVRVLAGAFGAGLPERDLVLSPDHALFLEGHLIEAKTLVNGATVVRETGRRFVTYHHIELARHDVVLAEGLPAESYLESGNRMMFESDATPVMLHPDFVTACRDKACAKLLLDGPVVRQVRQALLDRAIALGFDRTNAVDLLAQAEGQVIAARTDGTSILRFTLPAGARDVALISSQGVPAELTADPADRRVLGVAIRELALLADGIRHPIALDDAAHQGFHGMEAGHRWTNGAARVALPAHTGEAVLEVTINGQTSRWAPANTRAA